MTTEVEFEVLGPVRVRRDGGEAALRGRLQRTLLGVLLVRANRSVSVDALTEALWGGPVPRAVQRLHLHVHKLRRNLAEPDRLSLDPAGYRLRVLPGELDAERFELLVDEAASISIQDPERCVDLVRKALSLWRATPYSGLDVPELIDETERLSERRLVALERLYQAELSRGRYAAVVVELTNLVKQHPLREGMYGLLMTALYRGGRQADALAVYRSARQTLVEELGLEPGPELRAIEQQILAGKPVDLEGGTTPRPVVPAQLPYNVRSFVGRDAELAALNGLLTDGDGSAVIAVLSGTAGVGKTALAVRWAHDVRTEFPDGQLYVDLCGYGPELPMSPADTLAGFLRALGVEGTTIPQQPSERATRFRTLVDGRRMLIVLDNARTVDQVRPLLPGTPSCFVLVTSRESLAGLVAREGAHRVELDRLSTRESRELLTELIGDRASAEPDATDVLIERCAHLPLALRIAAELGERSRARSIAELTEELIDEQGRLDLLDTDTDAETSVRAVFSWSYRHLDPPAAHLFRLCGVHPGHDIDSYALAAMSGNRLWDSRRALDVLVRAHLLDETSRGRYRSHDLLHAYAAELAQLTDTEAERDAALTRLLGHHLHALATARNTFSPHAVTVAVDSWDTPHDLPVFRTRDNALDWFAAERVNLIELTRVAAAKGKPDAAWRLAAMLESFFYVTNHWDDWITTHCIALQAVEQSGDQVGRANILRGLGNVYDDVHRYDEAIACHDEAAAVFREIGDRHGAAWNLNNLGVAHYNTAVSYDDPARLPLARECYRDALTLFHEVGDPRGEGISLNNLAEVHRRLHEFDTAADYLRQAMDVHRQTDDRDPQRFALRALGDLHRDVGRSDEAVGYYRDALEISLEFGDHWRAAILIDRLGDTHAELGDRSRAHSYWQQALSVYRELGVREADIVEAKLRT